MRGGDGIFEVTVPFSWRDLFLAIRHRNLTWIGYIVRGNRPTGWHMSFADKQAIDEGRFDTNNGVKAHKRLATNRPDDKRDLSVVAEDRDQARRE